MITYAIQNQLLGVVEGEQNIYRKSVGNMPAIDSLGSNLTAFDLIILNTVLNVTINGNWIYPPYLR